MSKTPPAHRLSTHSRIHLLTRDAWDRGRRPRLGEPVAPHDRTGVVLHHTVTLDGDHTPLIWESWQEVAEHTRFLQTVRAERLGADVPYSLLAYLMADGSLILAEGRGLYRSGAHTRGRNRRFLGIAFVGNFHHQKTPPGLLARALVALGDWLDGLEALGFDSLWTEAPPTDARVWAHRDRSATACPGDQLYRLLPLV